MLAEHRSSALGSPLSILRCSRSLAARASNLFGFSANAPFFVLHIHMHTQYSYGLGSGTRTIHLCPLLEPRMDTWFLRDLHCFVYIIEMIIKLGDKPFFLMGLMD